MGCSAYKSLLLRPNKIKYFSARLPNQISIELLESLLNEEKIRLSMWRIKPIKDTLTLEASISLLDRCKALDPLYIALRDELPNGINSSDYHLAVITIINYVLKRLKGKEISSC